MVKVCEASECQDEDDDGAGIGKPDLTRVQNYRIDDLPEEELMISKARRRCCEASATALADSIDLLAENLMALLTGLVEPYP
ncbi:hypothetical protein ACE6H2_000758 [Prunus campanulata]